MQALQRTNSESKQKFVPQITSSVIKADDLADWSNRSLLVPHEPIRKDLQAMCRVLQPQYFDGRLNEQWKVRNFFQWYAQFEYMVHHHHDVEEQIFIPAMEKRCVIPEKISADHKELLEALQSISLHKKDFEAAFEKRDAAAAQRVAQRLRSDVKHLQDIMLPHLAEEEEIVPPLLRQHFTQDEEKALVQKIIKSAGLHGNSVMLPWIANGIKSWMGPRAEEWFWADVPAPIRWAYRKWWAPRHEQNNVALLESLTSNADTWMPLEESRCTLL